MAARSALLPRTLFFSCALLSQVTAWSSPTFAQVVFGDKKMSFAKPGVGTADIYEPSLLQQCQQFEVPYEEADPQWLFDGHFPSSDSAATEATSKEETAVLEHTGTDEFNNCPCSVCPSCGGSACQCQLDPAPCVECYHVTTLSPYYNINFFGAVKLDMLFNQARPVSPGVPFFLTPDELHVRLPGGRFKWLAT